MSANHITNYINKVNERFQSGIAREHAYRADLQNLLTAMVPDMNVTNEPANVADCGNPDYVITKGKIPVAYIEAKDVGRDLTAKVYKEQFDRYRKALDNLMFTDYLTFRFYQNGGFVSEVRIADIEDGKVTPRPADFEPFNNHIQDFCSYIGQTIKSPQKLAQLMAAKARLLQNTLEAAVTSDNDDMANTSLRGQLETFRTMLIHDITPKEFADMYAQTLAYGMFAARLYDPTLEDFSRQEAAELIPKTNPFLRKLFQYIAGYDIDPRIRPTVDNLAEVFRATDVHALLTNFGQSTQQHDPIIHFYETFLGEYDPKLRKQRGVWYTPEPVVNFIVRAVDDILKTEFGLPQGLADNSKTTIQMDSQIADKRYASGYRPKDYEVHKVQVLDPATGTGTFLAEVIKHVYNSRFKAMQGAWSSYVEDDLIPRLNGFELLMASYAMAHLKLDLLLKETGYKPKKTQRFNVFLTNALEEHHPDTGTLFSQWLSDEANEANRVKRDTPVMVVMGNPPYAYESSNTGEWISKLVRDYYTVDGKPLKERNPKGLQDDYVKFLRFGQWRIEQNSQGILAFITNNGYLDNPTFRGMRQSLLNTFSEIYLLDLHGNAKKRESSIDGSKDENVFDIQQGVSIGIFIKQPNKKGQATVYHRDVWGGRNQKYEWLDQSDMKSITWETLKPESPSWLFIPQDFTLMNDYRKGFSLVEIFPVNSVGFYSARDHFAIQHTMESVWETITDFVGLAVEDARIKYKLGKDSSDWKVNLAQNDINTSEQKKELITPVSYRPFDIRFTYYTGQTKGLICRSRPEIMKNFIQNDNWAICFVRRSRDQTVSNYHITKFITDKTVLSSLDNANVAPLYLYESTPNLFGSTLRKPNFDITIITQITDSLGLTFCPDHELPEATNDNTFTPLDILDYIYAVLHSPTYRDTYKEFLKIDFPRVPYPTPDTFWQLVAFGGQLRQIHLLESPVVENFVTGYPIDGDNAVTRKMTKKSVGYEAVTDELGKVWINDTQYFEGVPLIAWEFHIGGYQPAQKWLKDRNGRTLSFDDLLHYQKIIVALTETHKLMGEIDSIDGLV